MKHMNKSGNGILRRSILGLVFLLASCGPADKSKETAAKVPSSKEFYVEVNGQTIYMKQWSFQGPPILFMGGAGEDMGGWKEVIPEFTDNYKVFAADSRGQGKSSKPESGYRWKEDIAEDIAQLVKKHFKEPVIMVGASAGAMTAAAVAAYHPKSVRALVLEDPPACDISIVFPYVRSQMKIRAMPYEERIPFYMENGKTEEQAKKASATVDKINVPAMNELLAGKAAFDIREILPLIKCEVLFMLGNPEKGSMAKEEYRVEFKKQIPHAKISEWSETGHHLHSPDPQRFVKEIKTRTLQHAILEGHKYARSI